MLNRIKQFLPSKHISKTFCSCNRDKIFRVLSFFPDKIDKLYPFTMQNNYNTVPSMGFRNASSCYNLMHNKDI